MEKKIRILFFNKDAAGVNYFRTQTPAMQLQRDHSEEFEVEINNQVDFNDYEKTITYLKSFDIIHYHRELAPNLQIMIPLAKELHDAGVTLIADIDDYWKLDRHHPFYRMSVEQKMHEKIIDNLLIADYITTTTDLFAAEIRKLTKKDNVGVFPNAIDPTWMKQFQDKRKPHPDGLVRITYMAGSSHKNDVQQMDGIFNWLDNRKETRGKFKTIVAGWDTEGTTGNIRFNQKLSRELQRRGLWDQKLAKELSKCKGDIDVVAGIPQDLKEQFRGKVFFQTQKAIDSTESVYLHYENILSDKYSIIDNKDYIQWLKKYERDKYPEEGRYARRWTQKANIYAKVLDETDISLAPLADNMFNTMKSNLKQVECWSRKVVPVCTDIPPYNVDGVHMRNCILIPNKKNAGKYWQKYMKMLIEEPNLREDLGNQLYEDFHEKYNLHNVTNNRAEFYKEAVLQMERVV